MSLFNPVSDTAFSTGSYTGDDAVNRAITHGLGRTPKYIVITEATEKSINWIMGTLQVWFHPVNGHSGDPVTTATSTYFYVNPGTVWHAGNKNTLTHKWIAF